jgi:hypothetical protein
MTTAHKVQVALLMSIHLWIGWLAYKEARAWLKDLRHERLRERLKAAITQNEEVSE